jgi:hypothetical protein
VNTRLERRIRKVPHTVDGHTTLVDEEYTVEVPVLPTDWDNIVDKGARTATIAAFIISIVWTATSIGELLNRSVPAPVAYGAAVLFDVGWIYCSAMEWLARHHPHRARLPRRASYLFLAIAMAAVATDGILSASIAVGIIGAVISAIAKGMWIIYMRQQAAPLDKLTQQVIDQRDTQERARRAIAQINRRSHRVSEELATYTAVQLAARSAHPTYTTTIPVGDTTGSHEAATHSHGDSHGGVHDGEPQVTGVGAPLPPHSHTTPIALPSGPSMTKADAVRAAASQLHPTSGPADIARFLTSQGIQVSAAYVSNVLGRDKKKQPSRPPVLPSTPSPLPEDNGGYL